ncbi:MULTISPECIES: serine/threonine-protein kinase [unclassified Streptomyces]|uniref:serine/threonine-protein kinase n=1 Tax=unclassified Streptomyces TaxID=2593676 RepID=UPI00224E8BED|nr:MULTISPECIES: serine/threonine protein kinase [unclassified Streptomyces]MCX4989737.1 protein kinase [Streptomyces sp. NBC_00568]MCX5005023.1 protein kinase [Streptomyces sp. NBC_00638]
MGEVFAGRYELVDPIGRGGVGAVWRAWDHRRRRYVAAKVLQQSDAHALLRFVREQALRIDHPHVLAPASWAADDDKVLFTMDLVAGGSLVHLVNDYGPLPPSFVCTLIDQLLAGLTAVHAEGVVHRDIKPANVLLEATGMARPRLRLSDFGIAMRLGEPRLTETNYVVGTPGYFAPEQMLGSEPDFPADLFAVGLVALYLLEGAKPDAKALIEYFAEHGTPSAPRGIPEPLWQVVAMLLQPDPHARFRTATGARKALAAAVELLPEPGPDDELIEVFDQLGPLPEGFGPTGPLEPGTASGRSARTLSSRGHPDSTAAHPGPGSDNTPSWPDTDSGTFTDTDPDSPHDSAPISGIGSGTTGGSGTNIGTGADADPGPGSDLGPNSHAGSGTSLAPDPRSGPGSFPASASGLTLGEASGSDLGSGGQGPVSGSVLPGLGADGAYPDLETGDVLPESRSRDGRQGSAQDALGPWPAQDGVRSQPASEAAQAQPGHERGRPTAGEGVQARPASEDARSLTASDDAPPDPADGLPPQPSSMSDTGSFHLPPPQPAASTDSQRREQAEVPPHQPQYPPEQQSHQAWRETQTPTPPTSVRLPLPTSAPLYPQSFDPTPTPTPPTTPTPTQVPSPDRPPVPSAAMPQHAYASTASYTARSVQVPPRTGAVPVRHGRRARPRPGPPAKVAVPMLLLALACFAVGFWALSQV